ncbi:class I SAM-dependent methyltransferase [Neobacillus rhizophilus]|uniref:Class I SAM-dependent methyltransferase n=1 Tax=Neobacillus rhizophilus TaxID=2833579 RepID=A0A942UBB2_9BACI|nr:class I SAM-dependent methyltransferase [Neobacillus rhizophilus]MBS4215948.1 class I SAM-dependent methyltransferase [Neobacillus rhizophilus]
MFITTSGRTNQLKKEEAIQISKLLDAPYIPRRKKSISQLQKETNSDCLVVGKERLELHKAEFAEPFFFHPNSAMFRIKRLLRGEHDPFAVAAKLEKGMNVLDCTLGLAGDAIVAGLLVGSEGKVTGLEGQKFLAYVVKAGLQSWDSGILEMNQAMKRITVINSTAYDYLKLQAEASVDCVYFDPMFEESIKESEGIKALGQFAIYEELGMETINEAVRVAKHRVVLKDHYKSSRFEKYGFQVIKRQTAKFHYGFIEK